jgi:hypothetical protein
VKAAWLLRENDVPWPTVVQEASTMELVARCVEGDKAALGDAGQLYQPLAALSERLSRQSNHR